MASETTLPPFNRSWAFFLDIDGTLADMAIRPLDAFIPSTTLNDLRILASRAKVVLVSGRSLQSIDAISAPFRFPAAGQHGLELRFSDLDRVDVKGDYHSLDDFRPEIAAFNAQHPTVFVEDKGLSIALHYRQNPKAGLSVRRFVQSLMKGREAVIALQSGKMVEEIKLFGATKGTAVAEFMKRDDFRGKVPLFAGDDKTDEYAQEVVNNLGGVTINIGSLPSVAHFRLSTPECLRSWLGKLAALEVAEL